MSESGPRGHLFVISAPSGGGKTSLVRALLEREANMSVAISHTTRPQRDQERDGVDYYFTTPDDFQNMVQAHAFLEHAEVFDHNYGTSREEVNRRLAQGLDVILDIDWQGARSIRSAEPDSISIFLLPPSIASLEQRLRGRGDSASNVARRMRDAATEMRHHNEYDYLVVNDDFNQALDDLSAIVRAVRLRHRVQASRLGTLLADLVENSTGS